MEIIEFKSDLFNGEFLCRFTFEDDTDVFFDSNGFECVNYNNLHDDDYYISKAQTYYENIKR
jgi:hypothetical protein